MLLLPTIHVIENPVKKLLAGLLKAALILSSQSVWIRFSSVAAMAPSR